MHSGAVSGPASLQNPRQANVALDEVPNSVEVRPVGLIAADGSPSKGLFYRRRGTRPRSGVHLMHPRTDQSQNYNILPLVAAGYAVLGRASRWPNNDVATVHEPLVLDVAAGVRFLREQGCERVVLLGNSGGGTMATFYQWQATAGAGARLTHTPAGDPFDLNEHDLPAADGVVMIGGHVGEGMLMRKLIDPSVVDERDPLAGDPALDLYNPDNGFQIPPESSHYDADFLAKYGQGQLARTRRLDALAHSLIERQREAASLLPHAHGATALRLERAAHMGWHLIVYRTTADPASVDLGIDPDDRIVQTYSTRRPDLENYGPNGFARYVTPQAWLSTWSPQSSRANTAENLAGIHEPLLIVHYAGDAGARYAEMADLLARSAATDKNLVTVRHADHYGFTLDADGNQSARSTQGTSAVVDWMLQRFAT